MMGDASVAAADLGSPERENQSPQQQGLIQAEAASDPAQNHCQGNGGAAAAANGHSKMSAKGKAGDDHGKRGSPASNPRLKASRSNFTVPQPFSLTTEKRASKIQSPAANGAPTPPKTQKLAATKRVESPAGAGLSKSHGSSPSPSPSPLGAGMMPRSGSKVEFVFRSDERAQKRMEFYANLTEKTKAREAERTRIQASTQQQMAAEIRKLRKDQTFKANPMPKFYQEPAPVRIDVKKTPPTRPKSPKLGRRISTSGLGEPPKIFARRSSDEYDISKVPEELKLPETGPVDSPPPPKAADEVVQVEQIISEREGSDHSSSRKSDSLIPKAALSEDEDHVPLPEAAAAAAGKEGNHALLESSRLNVQGPISAAAAENVEGVLQLPVSSSLLEDGEGDEAEEEEEGEYEDHEDHSDEDFPSPRDEDHDQEESVRVYISEEFRLAAASATKDDEDENDELVKIAVKQC